MADACIVCGEIPEKGRRYCKRCYLHRRKDLHGGSLSRYSYGTTTCSRCGKTINLWRKNSTGRCIECCNTSTNSSGIAHNSNRSYVTRPLFEEFLGRKLDRIEVIHHLDENIENNSDSNLILLSNSDHASLHSYLRKQRALFEKSSSVYDENCWNSLRVELTTAWLEMTGAKVIRIVRIGQSAAEPLKSEDHEEGSETMYVDPLIRDVI